MLRSIIGNIVEGVKEVQIAGAFVSRLQRGGVTPAKVIIPFKGPHIIVTDADESQGCFAVTHAESIVAGGFRFPTQELIGNYELNCWKEGVANRNIKVSRFLFTWIDKVYQVDQRMSKILYEIGANDPYSLEKLGDKMKCLQTIEWIVDFLEKGRIIIPVQGGITSDKVIIPLGAKKENIPSHVYDAQDLANEISAKGEIESDLALLRLAKRVILEHAIDSIEKGEVGQDLVDITYFQA